MLTFTVKNFGPLAEGTVELRPLTVFVGGSNTGKSYMAAAIWAVAQGVESANPRILPGNRGGKAYWRGIRSGGVTITFGRNQQQDEDAEAVTAIQNWIELQNGLPNSPSGITLADLPEAARLMIDKFTRQSLDIICENIKDRLRYVYGEDSEFAKNGKPADFSLTVCRDNPLLSMNVTLTDHEKLMPAFDVSKAKVTSRELENLQMSFRGGLYENLADALFVSAKMIAVKSISDGFPLDSYYLPAARSGIVQWHKVLAASLARQSRRVGLEPINIPSLPGVTTEFLGNLIELDKRMAVRHGFTGRLGSAIDFIETSVIRGKVDLDESGGLLTPEIVYLPEIDGAVAGKFTLEHTSSMVSELAPLVLFLKYLVNPGDLLVLEEPESHLHPAAQLQMARGIARLVNAGVRVLVTTHSGDFMGQIDNLISMSNVSRETAESLGLEPEECLYPEQVSAYGFRFDAGRGGSVVDPLPVGSDVGIEDQEFLPISELLYEQAITLQRNRLE